MPPADGEDKPYADADRFAEGDLTSILAHPRVQVVEPGALRGAHRTGTPAPTSGGGDSGDETAAARSAKAIVRIASAGPLDGRT